MTVKDVVSLLQYGVDFEIKGSFSGKIYHDSRRHRKEHLEKYCDMEVSAEPLYSRLVTDSDFKYCFPTIGIWMRDYDLCVEKEKNNDVKSGD